MTRTHDRATWILRRPIAALALTMCAFALASGCATKQFVEEQQGELDRQMAGQIADMNKRIRSAESLLQTSLAEAAAESQRLRTETAESLDELSKKTESNRSTIAIANSQTRTDIGELRASLTGQSESLQTLTDAVEGLRATLDASVRQMSDDLKGNESRVTGLVEQHRLDILQAVTDDMQASEGRVKRQVEQQRVELLSDVNKVEKTSRETLQSSYAIFKAMSDSLQRQRTLLEQQVQAIDEIGKFYSDALAVLEKTIQEAE